MIDLSELPGSQRERALMLEQILVDAATGGQSDGQVYSHLRYEFIGDERLNKLLPDFVRTCRTLTAFWQYIKYADGKYAGRRAIIAQAFTPLIDFLEGRQQAPGDEDVSDTLQSFDVDAVHALWMKALARRESDPEGAITVARTLLEAVCVHILNDLSVPYGHRDDLPKTYGLVAKELNLAPHQHASEALKSILQGATTLVNGLGTLRNKFSDAHAIQARKPVKPSPRHAKLAVNTAGAVATFLVETFLERKSQLS